MQHVWVREHHIGLATDVCARLPRGVAVVDSRSHTLGQPERVQRARLVLGERLRRIYIHCARRPISAEHVECGQVEAQRLARRRPGRDDRRPGPGGVQRLRLMGVQPLDPDPLERRQHIWVQLRGWIHQLHPSGSIMRLAHEALVRAPLIQQSAPRLGSPVDSQGLEIVEAMSVTAAEQWAKARSFHHSLYSPARIAGARAQLGLSVSVCLPTRECAQTVGEIVSALAPLCEQGAIDEIVVIDAASADGTAAVARRAGARVYQEAELMPELGPVLGKGDAMYRALTVLAGDVVCYLDADTEGFSAHFATGVLGPLVCEARSPTEIAFVKAFYRRPFEHGGVSLPEGGGRVNHLVARPALELFYPELGAVRQPLAGEVAARRELLEHLPFVTGYGVEIGMLIDAWRAVGLDGIAQVDLDEHRNHHQPLSALVPMAQTVLATVVRRMQQEGRLEAVDGAPLERPPLKSLTVA